MPWTLTFPFDTVDARVAARELLSLLRGDRAVGLVQPRHEAPNLVVQVEFFEGLEEPHSADLVGRCQPYLPRPPRNSSMMENFERIYGPREDRPNENGDHFTPELRQQLINEYIGTTEGRQRLAMTAMANPIRRNRDYQSIGRRTFLVEQLPEGALPVYDRDPNTVADIVTAHAEPRITPDFVVPDWIQSGVFARFIGPDTPGRLWRRYDGQRIVEIEQVLRPEDPPGRNGPAYVRVWTWRRIETYSRDTDPSANDVIPAESFARLWEPCDKPSDPQTAWERLLGDEAF